MDIGCCLTSDILWSFLMTVLPAEIIRPSFFHINVLRSKSIIAVDDVDEDGDGNEDDYINFYKYLPHLQESWWFSQRQDEIAKVGRSRSLVIIL